MLLFLRASLKKIELKIYRCFWNTQQINSRTLYKTCSEPATFNTYVYKVCKYSRVMSLNSIMMKCKDKTQ